jgi:hypothetical protein
MNSDNLSYYTHTKHSKTYKSRGTYMPIRLLRGFDFRLRIFRSMQYIRQSQGPRSLRCGSAAALLLGLQVRIPLGDMDVFPRVVCFQVEASVSG